MGKIISWANNDCFVEAFGVVVEEKDMLELMKMSKHNFSRSRLMHHPDFAGDKSSKRNDERSVKAKDNEITKGKTGGKSIAKIKGKL